MKRSEARSALESVPLFETLEDADLDRLSSAVEEMSLARGEILFHEGDVGDRAYVIRSGSVDVVKESPAGETLLARRDAGDVIGEMALLDDAPRMATVRARAGSSLLVIPKAAFDDLVAHSSSAARSLSGVLLARWRETQARLRQSERMAQLGTLTAGVAHELNNPAAAIAREASGLGAALGDLIGAVPALRDLSAPGWSATIRLLEQAHNTGSAPGGLARADLEVAAERALGQAGVEDPWVLASGIADLGVEDLAGILAGIGDEAVQVLTAAVAVHRLAVSAGRIVEGASRLSGIVAALKSYVYLDRGPVQDVDVARGIADTLMILGHKLRDLEVLVDLPDLPTIEGWGGELNQVWTNLIDNAADAVTGRPNGTIRIHGHRTGDSVAVEVEDNGAGIPDDVLPRIFDAFFTTKPPGSGTGLGLDIAYSVVVLRHGGGLDVESRPGSTVFRVTLPVRQE